MTQGPTISAASPRACGYCLCGSVKYEVVGPLREVVACHCEMCRRTSGHYVAATACKLEHLKLTETRGLRWYYSSIVARRGFCANCGSNLFWEPVGGGHISIMAGTLDQPTRLSTLAHIYIEEAGDYYRICDDAPRFNSGEHGVTVPVA